MFSSHTNKPKVPRETSLTTVPGTYVRKHHFLVRWPQPTADGAGQTSVDARTRYNRRLSAFGSSTRNVRSCTMTLFPLFSSVLVGMNQEPRSFFWRSPYSQKTFGGSCNIILRIQPTSYERRRTRKQFPPPPRSLFRVPHTQLTSCALYSCLTHCPSLRSSCSYCLLHSEFFTLCFAIPAES